MYLKNSLTFINEFFNTSKNQIRKLYLKSNFYNNKISKIEISNITYRPSLSILSCLVKYDKKKIKIEELDKDNIWENKLLSGHNLYKLNNFYWLFSIDLKSSPNITQSIIIKWIEKNQSYNSLTWQTDILSKRIISWIANSKLSYDESDAKYKDKFNFSVNKQINHLINEISKSQSVNDKLLGCTAIIITGLSYENEKFLNLFLNASKKTKKYYPFDFELKIEVTLKINSLEFEITIHNKSHFAIPINFGLHPYFNISDFKNLEFIDNPLNCQNQEKNTISNTLDELNNINLGVDLLMYTTGRSAFQDKIFKRQVTLNHPYPFDLGVIWSDPPRRMICLEPWTSPRNSFLDGFRNIMIPSNDNQRFDASIQIKSLK